MTDRQQKPNRRGRTPGGLPSAVRAWPLRFRHVQCIDHDEPSHSSVPRAVITPSPAGHWKPLKPGNFGWLGSISDAILRREITSAEHFPYLGGSQTLLVASDYAGNASSPYKVYAFLTTS